MIVVSVGERWASAVCDTEVVVVRGVGAFDLRCGGASLVRPGMQPSERPATALAGGTQLGKRYVDAADTVELLCSRAGTGTLSLGDTPLEVKASKPLPASD